MLGSTRKHIQRYADKLYKKRKPLSRVPDTENKSFLFVGGLHRSGTSILHNMLREHPMISGFYDTGAIEDEGQHLQSIMPAAHSYGGPGEFAFHPEAHLKEDSSRICQESRDTLLREWGAYYDFDKQVLLEKSPPNLIRSRFLRALFPNSYFVFIVRHPVVVALATEKWSKKTIIERLLHWHVAHAIMLEDTRDMSDCLVIRYEDFVQSPQKCLDDVCRLIDIHQFSPVEKVENYNEKYFAQWQRGFAGSLTTLQAVLPETTRTLERFGYCLDDPYLRH